VTEARWGTSDNNRRAKYYEAPWQVGWMIVRQLLTTAIASMAAGYAVAGLIARGLSAFLFGVTPMDPGTLGMVALLMLVVAFGASTLPIRRAVRVDPAVALRVIERDVLD
jgi:putative ABC transport system permease protein